MERPAYTELRLLSVQMALKFEIEQAKVIAEDAAGKMAQEIRTSGQSATFRSRVRLAAAGYGRDWRGNSVRS